MEAAIIACGSSALQPPRSLCLILVLLSLLLASLTAVEDWGTSRRQGSVTTTGVGASSFFGLVRFQGGDVVGDGFGGVAVASDCGDGCVDDQAP